jgi:hypothetical protein
MFPFVPTQRDPQKRVVSVLDAPIAHSMRYPQVVFSIEASGALGRLCIWRV